MFYAHYVLSKRGPLARIWLAAHWDKKLTKAHVFETDLEGCVENIISPQVKMALRTSGHLLLGVVRIYNRKAKYLLADCNEAFVKIKLAFRSGVVDLPEESREAQHHQIYIVEEFPNLDTPLPDITDFDVNRHLTLNQSRIDEITMPDEAPTNMPMDSDFSGVMVGGDMDDYYKGNDPKSGKDLGFMGDESIKGGFGEMDQGGLIDEGFNTSGGLFGEGQDNFLGDGFAGPKEPEEIPMDTADGAMDGQMMSPPPVPQPDDEINNDKNKTSDEVGTSDEKLPSDPQQLHVDVDAPPMRIVEDPTTTAAQQTEQAAQPAAHEVEKENTAATDLPSAPQQQEEEEIRPPAEAFALEPLDSANVQNVRIRRKRKLIIDHLIELDGQTMREQLRDVEDIVTTLDMAPPTKRLMLWKEMGGVDKLFSLPCQMTGSGVNKMFSHNLHNTIPQDLVDVTGTQLQERFGDSTIETQQQTSEGSVIGAHNVTTSDNVTVTSAGDGLNTTEASSMQIGKDDTNTSVQQIQQAADTSAAAPFAMPSFDDNNSNIIGGPNDVCMNQINAVLSDDEYDAISNGPHSVGDDSVGAPSPLGGDMGVPFYMDNVLPQPSIADTTLQSAAGGDQQADTSSRVANIEPQREPEPVEGISYADDLEDLRWNKRTQHLINDLDRKFKTESEVSFFRLSDGITRKQAVSKFYSLLVLAKQEAANLSQSEVFGDVYIKKGSKFESVLMI